MSERDAKLPPKPSDEARALLGAQIPRRRRVTLPVGLALAFAFALLVVPAMTADRWLYAVGVSPPAQGEPATITARIPPFAGHDTIDGKHLTGGGVIVARGVPASRDQADDVSAVVASTPHGALPFAAYGILALALAALFTHHMARSNKGRLLRVQLVCLSAIVALALAIEVVMLTTALSVLVVPVAVFALVPTLVLDRVVGLATGVLAALVTALLVPFDTNVAILLLVQAATAGLVVPERPKQRWKAALTAGLATTVFTVATYVLLTYFTTNALPPIEFAGALLAAAVGPLVATAIAVPLAPLFQILVGEITQSKLVELEDLGNPLLKQIADRAPGTWQHSLAMANMAEIAANAIGANGRLVRVGAYYHDLGKSLAPKYFIENLESGETSPHDGLPPEVSCNAIFSHVTEGIVAARKAGLHERIVDFMHMHHGNGVLEYFWSKAREQGNPKGLSIEQFRYPGHPPQSRETAILAITDAVEAASRTLKKTDPQSIDSLVQRIVYGKLHLGQLDESGLSMSDLRRISDSLKETIKHANHGRIEYPWQKEAANAALVQTGPRLDSLDRPSVRDSAPRVGSSSKPPVNAPDVFATTASYGGAPTTNDDELDGETVMKPGSAMVEAVRPPIVAELAATSVAAAKHALGTASTEQPIATLAAASDDDHGDDAAVDPELELGDTVYRKELEESIKPRPRTAPVVAKDTGDSDPDGSPETILQFVKKADESPAFAFGPTVPGGDAPKPPALGPPRTTLSGAPAVALPVRPTPTPARKRAATLPPAPVRRAPTVPPPTLVSRLPAVIVEAKPKFTSFEDRVTDRQAAQPDLDAGETDPSMRLDLPLMAPPSNPGIELPKPAWAASMASRIDAMLPTDDDDADGDEEDDDDNPNIRTTGRNMRVETDLSASESPFDQVTNPGTEPDEWSRETPVVAPSREQLRSLLGTPDPTREQSIDEIERLHVAARSIPSEREILVGPRPSTATREVDPDDIEAAIEVAPRARGRAPSVIQRPLGVAKPKKP